MLNYNHVYYFHIVAQEGSIARAAQRLGVTQPTVSEQIRQLERSLGVTLFVRTATGLRLTGEGREAREHTAVMFRAADRLMEALQKSAAVVPKTLRVGVTTAVSRSVATGFLIPLLSLEDCVPNIRSGEVTDLIHDLQAFDLDLILCETDPADAALRGIRVVELHRPRLVAVVSTTKQLPDGDVPWNEIPLIHYRASSPYRWEIDAFLEEHGLSPRVLAETDDSLLMLEAAIQGSCVAIVPRSLARDAIEVGRVKVVATLDVGSTRVRALLHEDDSVALAGRAVERLIEFVREELAE